MGLTNAIPKSTIIGAITTISSFPACKGCEIQSEGVLGEIGARFLFALQIVTSLVALPFILSIGLLVATFHAITCDGTQALGTIQATMTSLTGHVLYLIPCSFVGIFASEKKTNKIADSLEIFAKIVADFWLLFCSQSSAGPNKSVSNQ